MDKLANIIKDLEEKTGVEYSQSDQLFALELVKSGDQTKAALAAGRPERSAAQRGYEMARDPEILQLVAEIQKYQSIPVTEEFITSGLMKEAVTAGTSRDRREALHLLGKTKTMFKDGIDQTNHAAPDQDMVETIRKMFGDEAAEKAKEELGLD